MSFSGRFGTTPPFAGPGQLLRNMDVQRVADNGSVDHFVVDPLSGEVRHGLSRRGVVDPYTIARPPRVVQLHMAEVFAGHLASDGISYIDKAATNEAGRLDFWNQKLHEAMPHPHAQFIARPVLQELGLYSEYQALH